MGHVDAVIRLYGFYGDSRNSSCCLYNRINRINRLTA